MTAGLKFHNPQLEFDAVINSGDGFEEGNLMTPLYG